MSAHRDRRTWGPDAERFNPARFVPQNRRTADDAIFKPFGTGPRSCIGRQFAYYEIAMILTTIIQSFELEVDDAYTLKADELLTLKPADLTMRFHPAAAHTG